MGRYKFLQENYAQVNKSLKALKDSLAQLESQFLSGNTTALAASDLQDIIRHITETLGLKVGSIQVIPPRESGAYLEIPIRIQFNANIKQLLEILYQLENHQKLIFIPEMEIDASRRNLNDKETTPLQVSLVISGIVKKEAKI